MCKHIVALGIGVTCLLAWPQRPPEVVADFLARALRPARHFANASDAAFGSAANLYTYGDLLNALHNHPKSKNNKALLSFDVASKSVTLRPLPVERRAGAPAFEEQPQEEDVASKGVKFDLARYIVQLLPLID